MWKITRQRTKQSSDRKCTDEHHETPMRMCTHGHIQTLGKNVHDQIDMFLNCDDGGAVLMGLLICLAVCTKQ